jgi:hypothetical protein
LNPRKPRIRAWPRAGSRRQLAHPFHPKQAATLVKEPRSDFELSRPRSPRKAGGTAKMRRTDAVQSTFSKTGTRRSRIYRAERVSSTVRWVTRFHDAHPLRPACSTAPSGVLFRIRGTECVTSGTSSPAAPRDALRIRREPRRATSLDRFRRAPRERPELRRSEMPSAAREPEGPLQTPTGFRPRTCAQRRFTRHGLRRFELSSIFAPQPQPRSEGRSRRCLTTSANHVKAGHTPRTFRNPAPPALFTQSGRA